MSMLAGIGRAILGENNPKFNFEQHQDWNMMQPTTVRIDCSWNQLINVAQNVPHLNVVISKGAEMFSQMDVIHRDKKGREIENSEVIKLLRNPNPLQSLEGLLYDYYICNAVYNATFQYKNYPFSTSELPRVLWVLPSGDMEIEFTGKMYDQFELSGIIKQFNLRSANKKYKPSEVIFMSEGIKKNGLVSGSKIQALQIPLSNIMAALKSLNIITGERGLIGFISAEGSNSDADGALPFDKKERERAEKDYNQRYSLDGSQGHVTFTSAQIKWTPMTFDVKQLALFEGLEDAFGLVCGAYGIDRDVFPSVKGATYENKSAGEKSTYNSTMLPLGTKLCNVWANHFGLTQRGETLEATFKHLPIMKEDELKEAQAELVETQRLSLLKKDGIINPESYAEMAEVEFTGTGATEHAPSSISIGNGNKD